MGNLNKQTKRILGDELEEILNVLETLSKENERQAKINLYLLAAVTCLILYNVVEIIQSFM